MRMLDVASLLSSFGWSVLNASQQKYSLPRESIDKFEKITIYLKQLELRFPLFHISMI